jgi:hypothetical protein
LILANIPHDVLDKERKVLYRFMAYRKLEPYELRRLVSVLLSMQKKKPKRNSTVIIYTTIK